MISGGKKPHMMEAKEKKDQRRNKMEKVIYNIATLVGKKVLAKAARAEEVEVKAVSPNGDYVKLGYSWYPVSEVEILMEVTNG